MKFDTLAAYYESTTSVYVVTGTFIFTDPKGTGPKHEKVNEIVAAYSPNQAALIAAKRIARRKDYDNSFIKPDYGYKVMPYTAPKTLKQSELDFTG